MAPTSRQVAAFLVKRPATIFGVGTARQGKVSPAVFAHPHLHFPLDALPEVVVNEVIDHLRLQNLCKHFIVDELKANRLHTEPKGTVSCCLVVGDHFLRYRFLGLLIRIQYMLDQLQDLSLASAEASPADDTDTPGAARPLYSY